MKKLAALLLCTSAFSTAFAQQQTIWQIGNFDDSSREFHDIYGVDYASPASDVNYIVGTSTAKDWLRFQPGQANGLTGARLHPFKIHFNLTDAPRGSYLLKLAMLYETPRLPALRIDVNGHNGQVTFSPKLDYAAGDWEGTFVPQTSHADRTIAISPAWLHTGMNTLTLTAVDNPAAAQNSSGDIAPGDSGLVYDALAFLHDPNQPFEAGKLTLHAEPTVFFHDHAGSLNEVVRACVNANGGGPQLPKDITLASRGSSQTQPLNFGPNEFGEACTTFDVPEWTGTLTTTLRAGGTSAQIQLQAQKKWTVLVVPHEHLDIGFTDYREKVAELQSQSIDGVLDMLPQHPEFRWTMDGSWVADQYLQGRSPQRVQQFLQAIRAGNIVLPPQYANLHTGVASLEGLTHSLFFTHQLATQNHLPVGAANITDVPSYSWSYASILHDAGVRYFAAASNSWRAPIMLQGRWNEKSPFYWEGPDGGRVLMWYSRAYLQLASMFGTPPTAEAVHDALPVFLQAYDRKDYRGNSVILYGSQLENTPLVPEQVTLPANWAKLYAYPRLEFSTFTDAMSRIQREFGDTIPTYRGDFGPYWEDGFTSDARATAIHRGNQQRLLNAEVMGTIPSLLDHQLRPNRNLLHDAWRNSTLFDEHTWTSVGATTTPESDQTQRQSQAKRDQANHAHDDVTYSVERSLAQLESFIAPKDDSLFVFNALPWARSGWLEADLPEGAQLVDPETNQPVPQNVLRVERGTPLPGFGGHTVRISYRIDNVPPVGYKLLSIKAAPSTPTEPSALSGTVLENRFYRVTLSPETGSIQSIWDKELKRELVDAGSPYKFGSYVYVTGADDMPNNSLYRYGAALPAPILQPHEAAHGQIVSIERVSGAETATLESSAPNTPSIRTTITLPDDARRIDIQLSLHKNSTLSREAAYVAFPFKSSDPSFAYDTQNGWVDPAHDELPGGSREWYATQHWAAVHDQEMTAAVIPIDAPIITFGDIVRGAWPAEFTPKSPAIFSWLMSNYWSTNFIAEQGGDYTFRYTIVSARQFEPAALTRTGDEAMTPLESDHIPPSLHPDAQTSRSFLSIDNKNVALSTWKRAEDGSGSILRLVEIAGHPEQVNLSTNGIQLVSVESCSLLEDCANPIAVAHDHLTLSLKPFEILTLKLHTKADEKQ